MSASSPFDTRLANLRARMAETGTDLVALGPSSHMVSVSYTHLTLPTKA